ncbi:lipid-A-disaccharide synthase [Mariprofundus ferrinatatus]|uniref:Lipid-A-disaccharide synthase n=1 Tax=Mariprofundus ferrinatatus TaxID=1921087 RepID=A0A2K8L5E6_9PROT|nr:lipid-A-disaccharide synthase [Mariprofundus ferrinatatus]ATX82332.1 lipid-A-disaccharide synthase [Mariprofundus ferrinatatus]
MTRFFISAGETSGDLHAATVVKELKARFPDSTIHGIAGSQMVDEGCLPVRHMSELNVMGLADVLRSLSRIKEIERSVLDWCSNERPDVAILVDFSSFHMRLGRKIRALGIPVLHFIAPKLWAWGGWRVRKLKRSQDRLACILPFEPEWFQKHGIEHAAYVGNPSAAGCADGWSAAELRERLEVGEKQSLLALLPGSRPQELRAHVPILAELLQRVRGEAPDLACVVPVAPGVDKAVLEPLLKLGAKQIDRTADGYAMRADAAVAVSGTATLELALWNTPTVLVYRGSPLMVFLARKLVSLQCAGLANIILGDRFVMPELIQEHCTVDNIMAELMPLLCHEEAARKQREEFSELRRILGDKQAASGVVEMVEELL